MSEERPKVKTMGSDPLQLATVTIAAVDRVGNAAADEMTQVAEDLEKAAAEVADSIRVLAARIRENSDLANQRLTQFVEMATHTMRTVRTLAEGLPNGGEPAAEAVLPRQPEYRPSEVIANLGTVAARARQHQ